MKWNLPKFGLGNRVSDCTPIATMSVFDRYTLGRVSDLVLSWMRKETKEDVDPSREFRLFFEGMLDFHLVLSQPENKIGIEIAIEDDVLYVSTRGMIHHLTQSEDVEKAITHLWMNSESARIPRKLLRNSDFLQVRVHSLSGTAEWCLSRYLREDQIPGDRPSFEVIPVEELSFDTEHTLFQNLGDLPFQQLLKSVYLNQVRKSKTGNFFENEVALKEDQEKARVEVERIRGQIEDEVLMDSEISKADQISEEDQKKIEGISQNIVDEIIRIPAGSSPEEMSKVVLRHVQQSKKDELNERMKREVAEAKLERLEKILIEKEAQNLSAQAQSSGRKVPGQSEGNSENAESFREKAIQMFQKLKTVKDQLDSKEKYISELEAKIQSLGDGVTVVKGSDISQSQGSMNIRIPADSGISSKEIDELNKKLDRTSRALEAEKAKVKGLYDRVVVAEKEAQAAVPLVEDLERKIEHQVKVAQQHKKETENVKQKLLEADKEKNRVQNELRQAQAQIQTLQKRLAA